MNKSNATGCGTNMIKCFKPEMKKIDSQIIIRVKGDCSDVRKKLDKECLTYLFIISAVLALCLLDDEAGGECPGSENLEGTLQCIKPCGK